MNDQELRLTRTHAAEEFQGAVLGLETALFAWVGLALLAGLAVFAFCFYARGQDFLGAAFWGALPPLLVVGFLRFCSQGRPPGFVLDAIDSLATGGHAVPPPQPPATPLHDL